MVDALSSLAGSRQAQAASLPVTLAQLCSLKAVADAVARRPWDWMAQEPPRGLDELVGPSSACEIVRRLSAK